MKRLCVIFTIASLCLSLSAQEDKLPYQLTAWERGIAIHPKDHPELKAYLWFYEWNMFGTVKPDQHSRGDWDNPVEISADGTFTSIDVSPYFKLQARVNATGAALTLQATNRSEHDWPELAGIIGCFNPGPVGQRTAAFDNEETFFRSPDGLRKLNKREIHWNDNLRQAIDREKKPDGTFVWTEKWPTAEPNATGGLVMRESNDKKWFAGIAWERFLSCQGHNPWECMHLGTHLGPLSKGASRTVTGQIYLMRANQEQMLDQFDRDFPRPDQISNARKSADDRERMTWMENMAVHHGFSIPEIRAATGLDTNDIVTAIEQLKKKKRKASGDALHILPYPGGRHPRIGFLEGAMRPQRETKISVFTPWDPKSYVVADIPEAIWWDQDNDRELLYLAHEHVPTHWTRKGIKLKPLEWALQKDGSYVMRRTLPNGVTFGTRVLPYSDRVEMEQWLTNGTDEEITGLRVQNCVMLKGAPEFADQIADNKTYSEPYAVCRDASSKRWIISAWSNCVRTWGNTRCPCLHSDPQFPDCPPGKTVRLKGWLSFYEGNDLAAELKRIEATNWQHKKTK